MEGEGQRAVQSAKPARHHGTSSAGPPLKRRALRPAACRSATEALKIVGESFPWSAAADWTPPRRVPAGGVNETDPPGHQTAGCGGFEQDAASHRRSNFVYLRANHKVGGGGRGEGSGPAGRGGVLAATVACWSSPQI